MDQDIAKLERLVHKQPGDRVAFDRLYRAYERVGSGKIRALKTALKTCIEVERRLGSLDLDRLRQAFRLFPADEEILSAIREYFELRQHPHKNSVYWRSIEPYRNAQDLQYSNTGTPYFSAAAPDGQEVMLEIFDFALSPNRETLFDFGHKVDLLRGISHPNILNAVGYGIGKGFLYIAWESAKGELLEQRLEREGPLSEAETWRIVREVAGVLDRLGLFLDSVIHGAIRADQILLDENGSRLLDVGRARSSLAERGEEEELLLGTCGDSYVPPYYTAPETLIGNGGDGRSDLWSLGILSYRCLTGALPFTAKSARALLRAIIHEAPVFDPSSALSRKSQSTILRLLEKDPGARFQSAAELIAHLESWKL